MINEPPNVLKPNSFVKMVIKTIKSKKLPINVEVFDTKKIKTNENELNIKCWTI